MTTYLISRHAGAVEWALSEGFHVDEVMEHLDVNQIKQGDSVIGTLPVNLIAEINIRGAEYFHLTLTLPRELRGQELSAGKMRELGARIEPFTAEKTTK